MTITTVNDTPVKFYTLAEVSANNGKNGKPIWIIFKNAVYDVTEYVNSGAHPGDPSLITEFAGRDCTRDFNDAGHSPDAMREMKTMKIGEIVENERKGAASGPKKVMSVQSMVSLGEDGEKKKRRRFLLCR